MFNEDDIKGKRAGANYTTYIKKTIFSGRKCTHVFENW